MNIIIGVAVLALLGGLAFAYWRICQGKEKAEVIRQEADQESWRAAQSVAAETHPAALEEAHGQFVTARDAMHRSFTGGDAARVEHCWVDVQMARENVDQVVSGDELARLAYDKVQALYASVLGQVWAHPTRALKLYPTLKAKVDAIIKKLVDDYRGFGQEDADRLNGLPRISQAELAQHRLALEGLSTADFYRRLRAD